MLNKFLLINFIVFFVVSCASTPKDTAETSGSGSASSSASDLETVDYTSDTKVTESAYQIEPGSQEDLVVNIGDRVCYASIPIGAYCEIRDFPSSNLIKIPDNISNDVAASISYTKFIYIFPFANYFTWTFKSRA